MKMPAKVRTLPWEIGIMDFDEGSYETGQVYHVHLRELRTGSCLRGIVIGHEECTFVLKVEQNDFFLVEPVAMRLLIKIANDMIQRNGFRGFSELVALDQWLNDRCDDDDGQWLFDLLSRPLRSFF